MIEVWAGIVDKGLELALIIVKDIPEARRQKFWEDHFARMDRLEAFFTPKPPPTR